MIQREIRNGLLVLLLACVVISNAGVLAAQTRLSAAEQSARPAARAKTASGLCWQLERVAEAHRGVMGISLKNLDTGEEISVNGDHLFPTASSIKLAVMCAVFDEMSSPTGKFPDYYMTMPYDDSTSVGGAGFVKQFKDGTKVELKELMHFMITVSDNVATNMLVEWLGGLEKVNDWLRAHGFEQTRMNSTIGGRLVWSEEGRREWGLGVCTPDEMRRLLEKIYRGEAGSTTATDEMLRLLGHQYFDGLIAGETPPTVWVGSKSGAVNDSRSDNAIVASPGGTYILTVYTKHNADKRWTHENEAEVAIRRVARMVYQHYNPKSTWVRPAGAEKL
jgi:beta-lactamase class A